MLLATPEMTLQKFLLGNIQTNRQQLARPINGARGRRLYLAVDFVPLRPMANMMMVQNPIPTELQHFYMAPDLVKTIELRLNIVSSRAQMN